jgi:hypothetical protein
MLKLALNGASTSFEQSYLWGSSTVRFSTTGASMTISYARRILHTCQFMWHDDMVSVVRFVADEGAEGRREI